MRNWSWNNQNKWRNKCPSKLMQSPIPIKTGKVSTSQNASFSINYLFNSVKVLIVRRFNEIIINFKNDPGLIMLTMGKRRTFFEPLFISFRFPGEHNILGNRYPGEMLINCRELNFNKNRRSNGLVLSIPLQNSGEYNNIEALESLSIDFWKYTVLKKGQYEPKDYVNKKNLIFDFDKIMAEVVAMQPLYYFYLGSVSTPPCDEYTYQIVVSNL